MGKETGIEWTDSTFNPWWGCEKISPGCKNCYAAALDHRMGGKNWGGAAPRRFFGDRHWAQPLAWNRAAAAAGVRHRVFCASMADVFEDRPDLEAPRQRLWRLINDTPNLDWLLLTKRPEHLVTLLPWRPTPPGSAIQGEDTYDWGKPWPNVWLGTTVEDAHPDRQQRVDILRNAPAVVRFLSMEPLLEKVTPDLTCIDWVIAGCESGTNARPARADWYRSLRDQCAKAKVAFFLKQAEEEIGARGYPIGQAAPVLVIRSAPGSHVKRDGVITGPALDDRRHLEFPTPRAPCRART